MAFRPRTTGLLWILTAFSYLVWPLSTAAQTPATIKFVQGNYSVPQTPQATVTVTFPSAQSTGNLNVVVVGWNDATATVSSVTDSKGNSYARAVGPTVRAGQATQSIYFAPNIAAAAANSNVVTVRFNVAASFPDIRIVEYNGLDTGSPLVGAVGSTGSSATTNSGSLTTTVPNVLLVAANVVANGTTGPGAGFTSRMITNPDSDIVEDRIATTPGTYSGTAPQNPSGYWVMQMVAFKAAILGPNTPPTISNIAAQTTNEDTATGAIGFTVGDAETAAGSLTVSGNSSNTTLVPNLNIVFGGTGANRTVIATPAANQNGTTTITITVSDGSLTASTSFQLTVNAVNDPPTITSIANQTTTAGTAVGPINFTVGDVETAAGSLTVSGSSSNQTLVPNGNIVFGGSGANRTVTLTPAANQTGTATITVTVSDGQLSTPTSFQLTVNATNTPPTISNIAAQTTNEDTATGAIGFTVADAETAAASLTVTGSSSNTTLVPNLNIVFGGTGANRTVTATPAANQNGTTTITITVSDGSLTASTSFQLTVNAVNDPPTITSIANQTTTAGTAVGPISFTVGDMETAAGSLTVSGSSSNQTLVPNGNIVFGGSGANRTVTLTPAANQTGTATITVTVSDASLTASSSFLLTVSNNGTPSPISFVQGNYAVPQTSQSTVTVAFTAVQSAGNLNVVVVGWNESTATVTSVTDSKGNSYTRAVGPTVLTGLLSQSIYFAPNIATAPANSNIVTVRFNIAAAYPDIRILEYSGLDRTSPVNAIAAATGSGTTSNSGSLTTTVPNVLLVAANMVGSSTTGPGTGFTSRMITNPDSDIVEDRMVGIAGTYSGTASLGSSSNWVMQMVAFKAAIVAPDTTPPTVAISAPAAGSTVFSLVSISANTSDNVGVAGVQFFVDGQPLGAEAITPPFSVVWDTTNSLGNHVLTAVARDLSNNTTMSAPVSVTVAATTPDLVGQWAAPFNWPIVAVNAILLPTGDVLAYDGQSFAGTNARVWNPTTNGFTSVDITTGTNIFCTGNCHLPDGRVLVTGGHVGAAHVGVTDANVFNPTTRQWTRIASMHTPRWYPTNTTLPDGRILVTAGEINCDACNALIPEIYNPITNTWTELPGASLDISYYPHMFVLPDGRVLAASTAETPIVTQALDISTQTWSVIDTNVVDGGSAVMYLPGKVLKSGTSTNPDDPPVPSAETTYVIDMTLPAPKWREVSPMVFPRVYHTLTNLPDGKVLATGGGPTTDALGVNDAIKAAELWSPDTETWETVGSMQRPRLYHSTALLLTDARVLVMGGGRFDDLAAPTDQLSGEIYSPPYLFKGPRPVITSAPVQIGYGQTITVQTPDASGIAKVSMIKMGAVTHAFNMDQRYVPLSFTAGSGSLSVQTPANGKLAPPGHYMLFIVDTNGVPSVAVTLNIQ